MRAAILNIAGAAALVLVVLAPLGAAVAQTQPEALPQGGASPGSQDSIPTDKPKLRAFCPDRPGQGTLPCTVDAGHFQVESDAFNVLYDRYGGRETYTLFNPTLKFGVTPRADLEVSVAFAEANRSFAGPQGKSQTVEGPGDVYVRYKQNLYGDYRGPFAVAIEPFIKAPTARRGVGDGAWEGGVLAPFAVGLSKTIVINLTPELDIEKDSVGSGVHTEEFGAANVSISLPLNLSLLVELAARRSQDAFSPGTQCYSDFALSLGLKNDLEIDIGVNHGLNRFTPSNQVYVGFGKRF